MYGMFPFFASSCTAILLCCAVQCCAVLLCDRCAVLLEELDDYRQVQGRPILILIAQYNQTQSC